MSIDRRTLQGAGLFIGLIVACFGFALLLLRSGGGDGAHLVDGDGPRVGVVRVGSAITDTTARRGIESLRRFRKDDEVVAVLLRIDSPGGMVGPSQELYREVERTRKTKPVVASLGSVAASGGYYIAAACDKIVASPGTITGSIGVITETAQVHALLDLARVEVTTFTSGRFKDTGSSTRPMREDERTFMQQFVEAIYRQFLRDVARGRKLKESQVKPVADGRVLTGEQAKEHKLVDELGNFSDALALAARLAKAEGEPVPIYLESSRGTLAELLEELLNGMIRAGQRAAAPGTRVELRETGIR